MAHSLSAQNVIVSVAGPEPCYSCLENYEKRFYIRLSRCPLCQEQEETIEHLFILKVSIFDGSGLTSQRP